MTLSKERNITEIIRAHSSFVMDMAQQQVSVLKTSENSPHPSLCPQCQDRLDACTNLRDGNKSAAPAVLPTNKNSSDADTQFQQRIVFFLQDLSNSQVHSCLSRNVPIFQALPPSFSTPGVSSQVLGRIEF
mmetsp:Transcript_29391/g.90953  ORF Transcript_29391/g.90953 Transcript_29391/m.90953 type:complete len:131 (-) Transcript_29391:749-1141(-)